MSPAPTKGPVSQRELVPTMIALIDAATAPNSTAHRDIARNKIRTILEAANWRTGYVLWNLGPTRCKYLASIGHWVPSKYLFRDSWHGKAQPPEIEE